MSVTRGNGSNKIWTADDYIYDKYEEMPLKKHYRGYWYSEYEKDIEVFEEDLIRDKDRYRLSCKEEYDDYVNVIAGECYLMAELKLKEWIKILNYLKDSDKKLYEALNKEIKL